VFDEMARVTAEWAQALEVNCDLLRSAPPAVGNL
jgi:hypothetical protein